MDSCKSPIGHVNHVDYDNNATYCVLTAPVQATDTESGLQVCDKACKKKLGVLWNAKYATPRYLLDNNDDKLHQECVCLPDY